MGGKLKVSSITLGAAGSNSSTGQFTGCIDEVIVNSKRLHFTSATGPGEHTVDFYNVTSVNVTVGCEGGGACQGAQCPVNSECHEGWLNYSCHCKANFRLLDNGCVDPCVPNPCQNGGVCSIRSSSLIGFQCECEHPYEGITCEEMEGEACPSGLYRNLVCRLCLCDPEGVEETVCDGDTGDCLCQVSSNSISISVACTPHWLGMVNTLYTQCTLSCESDRD